MTTSLHSKIFDNFQEIYNSKPEVIITAPGRINLIGEHTDYSEGFVLPVAINLAIKLALSPRNDRKIVLYSTDFDQKSEINLMDLSHSSGWQEYTVGVAWVLTNQGYQLNGWNGVLSGSIPIGAGLSSSAALELACVEAFCVVNKLSLSPKEMAVIGRQAEVGWVGVNVGIMDQLISAAGKPGHAMLLDCRTLSYEYIPIPPQASFVVLDTMTRRQLSNSAYNERQQEVKIAAELLGVDTLRDSSLSHLEKEKRKLPETIYHRARHVISENERVVSFCDAMRCGDLAVMGKLINESHLSLREDYEVSSGELDLIVEIARSQPNCLGARMTGAGFGGCALALTAQNDIEAFIHQIETQYQQQTGLKPHIFPVSSADGISYVQIS